MDMTCHIFMHLIDGSDTVNARFVWKRASDKNRKESKALNAAWGVAKAIKKGEYAGAFKLLDVSIAEEQKSGV